MYLHRGGTRGSTQIAARCLRIGVVLIAAALLTATGSAQVPAWCKALPRLAYRALERVPVNDSWFAVYKVAPDTFAIYEPHQSEETISYLIVGQKRALLFDTGLGIGDLKALTAKLTTKPVAVVNSHTHNDHVGDNWQFDTVYSMDTAFSRADAGGSVEDAQAEIKAGEVCGALPQGFDRGSYRTRPWKISAFIRDGYTFELGGRTLQVIATPGHTPDAICLWDRTNGLLFTGDTFYPGPIWLYRPETSLADYRRSVDRLVQMTPQVRLVLGAHNVPVAPASSLRQLQVAFEDVVTRKPAPVESSGERATYRADGVDFVLSPGFTPLKH